MRHVVLGMMREEMIQLRRYPLNTVSAFVTMYIIFLMLVFGVSTASSVGISLGHSMAGLVVGYWVFLLSNVSFQNLGYYLSEQAMVGTLEQLYLSPYGFAPVALGKMLGILLYNVTVTVPFILVLMATTRQWLHFDVVSMTPLLLAVVLQSYGLGLAMGGLVLIQKRVQALYQLVTMLLGAFIVLPADASPLVRFLPLNTTWRLLRAVMADGESIVGLPRSELAFVLAQTVVLFGFGTLVYRLCEGRARRLGTLGQY